MWSGSQPVPGYLSVGYVSVKLTFENLAHRLFLPWGPGIYMLYLLCVQFSFPEANSDPSFRIQLYDDFLLEDFPDFHSWLAFPHTLQTNIYCVIVVFTLVSPSKTQIL